MKKETSVEYQLIKDFLDGNTSALQQLIEKHKNRVFSYIFMMVKDRHTADDLFQDTFIKVINTLKSGTYSDEGKFINWVMRIAHNLVIDHFRKQKKTNIAESRNEHYDLLDHIEVKDLNVEEKWVINQIHSDVKGLLDYLPDEQKEVLFLRCYAGLSFKEISEHTEVSINTALGRMRYALMNLRKIIKKNNIILTS